MISNRRTAPRESAGGWPAIAVDNDPVKEITQVFNKAWRIGPVSVLLLVAVAVSCYYLIPGHHASVTTNHHQSTISVLSPQNGPEHTSDPGKPEESSTKSQNLFLGSEEMDTMPDLPTTDNGNPPPGGMRDGSGPPPMPPEGMRDGNGPPPPPPGSRNGKKVETTAVYTLSSGTSKVSARPIEARKDDQSAVKVCNGAALTLSNLSLTKVGDTSSTEDSDFYGLNAAVLAKSGGRVTISNCTITTRASGGNAVFATGNGSSVTLSNVKIDTTGRGSSRGLDGTFGASINAKNVSITTAGAHSAAIATDRGGARVKVTGGVMTTSGMGSPGIYSTGDISVTGAKLTAKNSEAAVIEGKNSIALTDSVLLGKKDWGVMLYQSFSGDAEVGTSVFTMNGGALTAEEGPLFYTTNTKTRINLKAAELKSRSGILLKAAAGRWGTSGSNGADVSVFAECQQLAGNIICDGLSSIAITLKTKTALNGCINTEKSAKLISLALDRTSKWSVTGTSHLTSLSDEDTTLSNILGNGFTVHYNPKASGSSWLGGKTYRLANGGYLSPK